MRSPKGTVLSSLASCRGLPSLEPVSTRVSQIEIPTPQLAGTMLVLSTPFGSSNGNSFFFFFPFIISSSLVMKSCLTLATRWTVARQAPPPTGFSRQEYQSGLPFPSPFRALDRESLLYHITGSVGRVVFILCQEMASSFKTQSACLFSHSVMSSSLQPHGLKPARSPGP